MRVREWQDVVRDVIEQDVDPDDWRAIAGPRNRGVGEDLYLGHPNSGVYVLKTYTKNPYELKGVGSRVARSLDDEIGGFLPDEGSSRFAVHPRPNDEDEAKARARRVQETVRTHAAAPTTPDDLFTDLMDAIESPAFGPLEYDNRSRPPSLDGLAGTFDEAENVLNAELEDLIDTDEIDRGFM